MDRRSDYDFALPAELIAQEPARSRSSARLLRVTAHGLLDGHMSDLLEWLPRDAVVLVNDTRVLPARVHARKPTGGAVELLFLEPTAEADRWRCLARASKPIRAGMRLEVADGATVEIATDRDDEGCVVVQVDTNLDIPSFLERHGELPLPPYIERAEGPRSEDRERYQTVFAAVPGAVAAPTAGLHFTPELLEAMRRRGAEIAAITLHVGLGTFSPVRHDHLDDHVMHRERYVVSEEVAALVASGRPVVAIGTTVVRALESAAVGRRQLRVGAGSTRLFIRPGYEFRIVDHLVTNFHLPQSTLLMLVAAFAGYEQIRSAYRHAIEQRYRFFSYGDAMFLSRSTA